jgi:ABC-2 type transport system permease protein
VPSVPSAVSTISVSSSSLAATIRSGVNPGFGRARVVAGAPRPGILACSCWRCRGSRRDRDPHTLTGGGQAITFVVSFLPYPSSAFVPIHTVPSWLRGVAEAQPVTQVVDAIRGLLDGGALGASAWHAVDWSLGIIAVSIVVSGVLYRRRVG